MVVLFSKLIGFNPKLIYPTPLPQVITETVADKFQSERGKPVNTTLLKN